MTIEEASVLDQLKELEVGGSKPDDPDTSSNAADTEDIEFVLVPCDATKPMRKMILPSSAVKGGDNLPEFVKPYFADSRTVDVGLMNSQREKTIASSSKQVRDLATETKDNISAASLNAVAAKGSVETFPLVRPASSNFYQGVYIYMDELGMLKKLPPNERARSMAEQCGYHSPSPNFYGDVFIGRVQTKPALQNMDFTLGKDTDRGAEWMQRAPHENRAWHDTAKEIQAEKRNQNANNNDDNDEGEASMDWEQNEEELEIRIPFPNVDVIDKSKVKVTFLPKAIKIKYDGVDFLSIDPLFANIDSGDGGCTWTIEKPNTLVVTVEISDPTVPWPQLTL
ncbi:MAG: hypothetical protein SGILL_003144 [Bacillariaceae sp.]